MTLKQRVLVLVAISASCVACDQETKHLADLALKDKPPIEFLDHTIKLMHAQNLGAWGSLGAGWPEVVRWPILVLLPLVALVGLGIWAVRTKELSTSLLVATALFLGGGLGNLIDRVFRGSVVDFVVSGKGVVSTNVFNVADVAIVAAGLLFLFESFRKRNPETKGG